jgi:arginase
LERSPTVLRDLGVADAIGAGVVGAAAVARARRRTRDAVENNLNSGNRPVVLGCCCTYVIGAMAAATREFDRCGLVDADGHLDLFAGQTSPTGEAAAMSMAAMLGRAGGRADVMTRSRRIL